MKAHNRPRAEATQRPEALFRSLVETTGTGYVVIDPAGHVLDANGEYCRLSGHASLDEIVGRNVTEWTALHEKEKNADAVDRCARDGYIRNFEIDYIDRHGVITPVEINATVVNQKGSRRILTLCRDISQRRKTERALRESEQRFLTLSMATSEGVVISEQGRFVDVNNQFVEILGYERSELLGRSIADTLPPEDSERVMANILLNQESYCEHEMLRKDGSRRSVEAHGTCLHQEGRHFRITAIRDITERKRMETEREQFVRFFSASSDLMCIAGTNGYFTRTNPSFSRTLGYSAEELLAKPLVEFIHPDDRQSTLEVIERQLRVDSFVVNFENRYIGKDGTVRWLSWNAIYKEEEQLIYGIGRDITDRKQFECELAAAYRNMDRQVRERTATLTQVNEQLENQIEERKRIEQELLNHQRMLETMGLEISLAAEHERVRIAGELHDQVGQRLILCRIKMDALTSQLHGSGHEKAIDEMQQMIDLTLKDIRSLTFQLRPPILASAGLEAAVEWLGEELKESYGLNVAFDHDPPSLSLSYETRSSIFQVVRELLLNVVKHAGTNRAHISIRKEDGTITITVSDKGVGFDTNRALARNRKSGGFGLFNVQRRIEYLGGRFVFESKVGQGSRATIIVPFSSGGEQE